MSVIPAKRILLVDDEVGFVELMKHLLETEGYEVAIAHDGQEALEMLDNYIPDIIISDVMMPRMNGLELFKKVRVHQQSHSVPFIFMSGYKDEDLLSAARKVGVFTILSKPVDFNHLLSRVKSILKEK